MRFFRSGYRVARVDVAADAPLGAELLKTTPQVYSMRRSDWIDRPQLAREIAYSGNWDPCSEADAYEAIEQRQKRLAQFA
ncbi:hypothetical protein [Mycolicibacterium sp. XJ1904]